MNDKKGFAAALVVFIVLVLIIAGGIAWVHYYYLPNMATQNTASSTATAVATTTGAQPSVTTTSTPIANIKTSSTPVTVPPKTVTTSNNNEGGIDTSSWQTESIHFAPNSVCWTIKYPPTLSPSGANNGYSSIESFVNSETGNPPVNGVMFEANFNATYSQEIDTGVTSVQNFTTTSGLSGEVQTDNLSGNWHIFIGASENGKDFVLNLQPMESTNPPYDINTAEAMARSVTLSCALPASAQ
jgi:hypothetical protein